jgi:YD repeat-containing protein
LVDREGVWDTAASLQAWEWKPVDAIRPAQSSSGLHVRRPERSHTGDRAQTYPNTTTASVTYDTADNLTQILDKKGTSTLWTFGYTPDPNNQVASTNDPTEKVSHTYGYDTLNRLSQDSRPTGSTTWTYDAADQLTTIGDTGAKTTSTHGDRTSQADSVSKVTTTYGYDQADRLTSFVKSGKTSTSAYDGDGLRAKKTVSGTAEPSTWGMWPKGYASCSRTGTRAT